MRVTSSAQFRHAYALALGEYLRDGSERPLQVAYDLGRTALSDDLSVVEIALIHHELLAELAADEFPLNAESVVHAGQFLSEALSACEMVARGFEEVRAAVALERRHAGMLRQLSAFMGDVSLAMHSTDSVRELVRLVAENARELTDASAATVTATSPDNSSVVEVANDPERSTSSVSITEQRVAVLSALDGRDIGSITITSRPGHTFGEMDDATLAHLSQMASAALERIYAYRVPRRAGRR
jgi:hypothetical protein